MLIVYDSLTGNVERFVRKLTGAFSSVKVKEGLIVPEKFVLVTYTTGFGQVPPTTESFLEHNHRNLLGVAVSGNRNWGKFYGRCGDIIAEKYNVPLIVKFELHGTPADIKIFTEGVRELYEISRTQQRN